MEIRGKAFINKGQYGFYMTVKDREDAKVFLTVGFRKGEEPDEGGEFNLKNAFLSAYKTRNGESRLKLVVLEYEQVGVSRYETNDAELSPSGKAYPPTTKFVDVDDDGELPF